MKTLQQAFDTVIQHLATQNRQAVDHYDKCVYRTLEGLKCAIGSLIEDKFHSPSLESKSPRNRLVKTALKNSGWRVDSTAIECYCELQRVHDKTPSISQLGCIDNPSVIYLLKNIAQRYDLIFNPGPLSPTQRPEAA